MSEVFVYAYNGKPEVICNSAVLDLQKFKNHWFSAFINELSFEVATEGQIKNYLLPHTGKFAVYKEELLEIQNFDRKVLFVSDLDGTLLLSHDEGKEAYDRFVKF